MYGLYTTQQCYFNPIITSISPADGTAIAYGTFIDLKASFYVRYNEPASTYTYGWTVTRQPDGLDITDDVIKTYANTNILKVHLDNNII